MKIEIVYGNRVLALPAAVSAYLDKADPLTLRLFLLLCGDRSLREPLDVAALARSFAATPDKIEEALSFWENAGLIHREGTGARTSSPAEERPEAASSEAFSGKEPCGEKRPKTIRTAVKSAENGGKVTVVTGDGLPHYTGREIEALMNADATLSLLVEECQRIAGKLFGAHEINRLFGLSDYLRLDHDSILLLFEYASRLGKCSLPYIEKMACSLVNEGITSYAQIEQYVTDAERRHTLEEKVRALAGLSRRALTAKEKKFLAVWADLSFPFSMLEMAYEITVNNTGGVSFPYMNKVLLNWREAGYTTAEQVNAALGAYREKREKETAAGSFDVNEFFEAALKRSYERMEQKESSPGASSAGGAGGGA